MQTSDNDKVLQDTDYGKLYDALERIKITCENHFKDGCVQCPLGDKYGACCLSICPNQWRTRHPDSDVFRMID